MPRTAVQKNHFDDAAAEAFLNKMASVLDHGAVAIMTSIGHRAGLFETMAGLHPARSDYIAERAGLSERYVREWLAVMVTGGVVGYDPARETYVLPAEHAACLTNGAPLGNLAIYAQAVALAGAVQERVLDCFSSGDGLRYDNYPCFHHFMAEDSQQTVVDGIGDIIQTLMPEFCTKLDKGIAVLDAGCGSGRALIRLAQAHPASRFVGYDLCQDAIATARTSAAEKRLENITFEARDLTGLDTFGSFDLITSFDAVHDMADPQAFLRSIHKSLNPDGAHLMQDIGGSALLENNKDFPFAPLLYMISCVHCTPISLGQGGDGLGAMWGWETAEAMLNNSGFSSIERTVLPHDPMNVWFVSRY